MGSNKCASCGQWSGRGHKCPVPANTTLPGTAVLTPRTASNHPTRRVLTQAEVDAYLATLPPDADQYADAIADAEQEVAAAETDLAEAIAARSNLEAADIDALRAEHKQELANAETHEQQTREAAQAALNDFTQAAKNLYIAHGVSPRYAEYYAKDMRENATRSESGEQEWRYGEPRPIPTPRRLPRFKVKPSGPDKPRTEAAAKAALNDPDYVAARGQLSSTMHAHIQAEISLNRVRTQSATARGLASHAQARHTADNKISAAETRLQRAQDNHRDLQARRDAGVPISAEPRPLSSTRTQIARQPDGTVNAWVRFTNDDGTPAYERVTGLGEARMNNAGQTVNTLRTESGRTVFASSHYYNTRSGGQEDRFDYTVLVSTPAEGSRPLNSEGNPNAGYYTYTDSTD